jgi:hypothetical protein
LDVIKNLTITCELWLTARVLFALNRKGEHKLEFIKLKIDQLVHASYNPRKDLKAGDPEFEKIRNSIAEGFESTRLRRSGLRHNRC